MTKTLGTVIAIVAVVGALLAVPSQPASAATLPLSPSSWTLAYGGQDATLSAVTYDSQSALQWQVTSALGHSDWVYSSPNLQTDETYTFSVELAGSGTAALNIWNGVKNVPTKPVQLTSTFQTLTETVPVVAPDPQFQILDPDTTSSALDVYVTNPTETLVGPASGLSLWGVAYSGQDSTLTNATYDGSAAYEWQVTSALGHSDWAYSYPPLTPGDTYTFSVQVAGTGSVELNIWDGNENVPAQPVTLTSSFQTLTETVQVLAPNTVVVAPSSPQFQLVDPDTDGSSAITLYFRDATWTQAVAPPSPPTGVVAQNIGPSRLKVSWNAPSACSGSGLPTITGYDVYVSSSPLDETYSTPTARVAGCGSGATSVIVPVRPGVSYASVEAVSSAGKSSPSPLVSTVRLRGPAGEAQAAVEELQTYYDPSTGLFNTTGWWNSANALNAIIDYMRDTGSRAYLGDVSITFTKAVNEAPSPTPGDFIDTAYDDTQWWALTWLNAYNLTRDRAYLHMAEKMFSYVTNAWTPSQCGGGLIWMTTNAYKNAVTNELFLKLSSGLYQATHQQTYLGWATKELTWFNASGMITSSHLINDGLNTSCQNNGQTTWTYNQGSILGGLVSLYQISHNRADLTEAEQIANATINTLVNSDGILTEICSGNCASENPNQTQFKGVFMRNLFRLYEVTRNPAYRAFILRNAASIWRNDRNAEGQLGYDWSGPVTATDQSFNASTVSSALDALNAAAGTIPGRHHLWFLRRRGQAG